MNFDIALEKLSQTLNWRSYENKLLGNDEKDELEVIFVGLVFDFFGSLILL